MSWIYKLRAFGGVFNSVDGYDMLTLCTSLPYNLIKQQFLNVPLKTLIADLFAAIHIKPSSATKKVGMLDILTGTVMRL